MTGEAAEVFVVARFFDSEDDGIFFTRSEKFGVGDDGFLVGFGGGHVIGGFGGHGFHGPSGEICSFFKKDKVVAHGNFGYFADVFESQFNDFASWDLDCLLIELHLVVAGDGDFEIGFFFRLFSLRRLVRLAQQEVRLERD